MTLMAERAGRARVLRDDGLKLREIAGELGVSIPYVHALLSDPDGSKARARKMRGTCADCGTAIYSDSPSKSPQMRCSPCQHTWQRANARWTREAILDAIRRWASLYGKPPTATAWNMPQAKPEDRERFRAESYPHHSDVTRRFGRWSNAILAAGFELSHPAAGKPRNSVTDADYRLMDQMRAEGKSLREIGQHFGVTDAAIKQRLKRRKGGQAMAAPLKAETVLEREIQRFEDRQERATREAEEAGEQVERLKLALAALSNGKPGN